MGAHVVPRASTFIVAMGTDSVTAGRVSGLLTASHIALEAACLSLTFIAGVRHERINAHVVSEGFDIRGSH